MSPLVYKTKYRKGVELMNGLNQSGVPIDAITKGRDLDNVLTMCMNFFSGANKAAATPGKSVDEIFADTMMAVVYRIYLLGVEDGMREVAK